MSKPRGGSWTNSVDVNNGTNPLFQGTGTSLPINNHPVTPSNPTPSQAQSQSDFKPFRTLTPLPHPRPYPHAHAHTHAHAHAALVLALALALAPLKDEKAEQIDPVRREKLFITTQGGGLADGDLPNGYGLDSEPAPSRDSGGAGGGGGGTDRVLSEGGGGARPEQRELSLLQTRDALSAVARAVKAERQASRERPGIFIVLVYASSNGPPLNLQPALHCPSASPSPALHQQPSANYHRGERRGEHDRGEPVPADVSGRTAESREPTQKHHGFEPI